MNVDALQNPFQVIVEDNIKYIGASSETVTLFLNVGMGLERRIYQFQTLVDTNHIFPPGEVEHYVFFQ